MIKYGRRVGIFLNRALCFTSLFVFIIILFKSENAFSLDRFTGRLAAIWEESADLRHVNQFLILERTGGVTNRLVIENPEQLTALINKEVVVEGNLNSQGDIDSARIVEILTVGKGREIRASSSSLRMLVAIVDITGQTPIPSGVTADFIRNQLFTDSTRSTKVVFETNSYGAQTIESVTVAERMNLAISIPSSGSCYPWYSGSMIPAVRSAFTGQGFDESTYDRVLIILPEIVGNICGFAGIAISSRETLYSGGISASLVAHELGHNFGFGHASTDTNNDGAFDNAYGDPSCIMGLFGGHYNLMHAGKQAWFLSAGGSINSYSGAGVREIQMSPTEIAPASAPHMQLVQVDPIGGGRPYYITFRKNSGTLDSYYNLDAYSNNKLYVLRPPATLTLNTVLVAEIQPGESFYSASDQLLIEFPSEVSGVANVKFTLGPVDSDNDGTNNDLDTDDDNDGVLDGDDCSPTNNTRWTRRAYLDADNDGFRTNTTLYDILSCVGNAPNTGYTLNESPVDNCYTVSNADQIDTDHDGWGDACDSLVGPGAGTVIPTPPPVVTPPPGGSYDVLYSLTVASVQKTGSKFKLGMVTYGGADAPIVTCAVKAPNKRKFAAAKPASLSSALGYYRAFQCSGKLLVKGTYKVKVKACDRGNRAVCFGGSISIRKR